jgi:ATP-dependent 26S proteasome regulatory subunit
LYIVLLYCPAQVARCTKIIDAGQDDAKYIINVKQIAKFVVGLGDRVAPTDIEEGMRVGYVLLQSHSINFTDALRAVWIGTSIKFRFPCHLRLIQQ